MRPYAVTAAALAAAAVGLLALSAAAQGPRPGGPGGGPPGGPGGGPPGGMRRGGPGRTATVGSVPIEYLAPALGLTAAQKTRIAAIQTKHRDAVRKLFPMGPGRPGAGPRPGGPAGRAPGGRPGGGPMMAPPGAGRPGPGGPGMGGPPDRKAMEAMFAKIQAQETATTKAVDGVLTARQRPLLKKALSEAGSYRRAGIPLEVVPKLKLTAAQKQRIAKATTPKEVRSPQEWMQNFERSRKAVQAVLTPAQRKIVEEARPRMPGGFGGGRRGGPGMGGPGGGPGMGGPGGMRRS